MRIMLPFFSSEFRNNISGSKTAVRSTSSSSLEKIEAKRKRKIEYVVNPMILDEELFKDRESYNVYLGKLQLMKHNVIGIVDDFLELKVIESVIETMPQKLKMIRADDHLWSSGLMYCL